MRYGAGRIGEITQLNNDYKPEAFEEIFIPFLSDEDDEEFTFLQHLWQNDEDVLEQLKTAVKNQE